MKNSGAILSVKVGKTVYIHCDAKSNVILYGSTELALTALECLFVSAFNDKGSLLSMAMMDFRVHRVEIPCYITTDLPAPIRLLGSFHGFVCRDPKAASWHARGLVPKAKQVRAKRPPKNIPMAIGDGNDR